MEHKTTHLASTIRWFFWGVVLGLLFMVAVAITESLRPNPISLSTFLQVFIVYVMGFGFVGAVLRWMWYAAGKQGNAEIRSARAWTIWKRSAIYLPVLYTTMLIMGVGFGRNGPSSPILHDAIGVAIGVFHILSLIPYLFYATLLLGAIRGQSSWRGYLIIAGCAVSTFVIHAMSFFIFLINFMNHGHWHC